VPTKLPRHTITETPDVQSALDELCVESGAQEKARRLRAARAEDDALLTDLADRVRRREPLVDVDAADRVRRAGWARG
jgi:hypothetical protein